MDHRIEIRAGRPPKDQAEALGDHVVAVADALFIELGYGATSMATVAARARVGKQTLYRRFPDKATLFREVIRRRLDVMLMPEADDKENCDPLAALKEMGRRALAIVLDPEFLRLYRIIIAEALPFPELASAAADHWGSSCLDQCVAAIRMAQEEGLCRPGEPETFAQCFLWSVVGEPFLMGLSGQDPAAGSDHEARLEVVWTVFLEGVSTKK
jgi:TetR/AcrR family transcriptional repressor of mexJK operon